MLATEAEAQAETKAFSVETEAKTKTFSLEAEARPRCLKCQPRRDRAEALLRLETASRPRRQDRGHIPAIWSRTCNRQHRPLASCVYDTPWITNDARSSADESLGRCAYRLFAKDAKCKRSRYRAVDGDRIGVKVVNA